MDELAEVVTADVLGTAAGNRVAVILLSVADRYLLVTTTQDQIESIAASGDAADGHDDQWPNKHDLLVNVAEALEATVTEARIDRLEDDVFHATLVVEQRRGSDELRHEIDSRATDVIAIAERADCPIRVAESVVTESALTEAELERRGIPVEELT